MNFPEELSFLNELEERRYAAMLAGPDDLAPYLDDDVVYIHSSAVRESKAAYLESLRSGFLAYSALRPEYYVMQRIGSDGILLSGRIGIDIQLAGKPVQLDNLFTAVWRKGGDGQWRLLSWQSTPIPKK